MVGVMISCVNFLKVILDKYPHLSFFFFFFTLVPSDYILSLDIRSCRAKILNIGSLAEVAMTALTFSFLLFVVTFKHSISTPIDSSSCDLETFEKFACTGHVHIFLITVSKWYITTQITFTLQGKAYGTQSWFQVNRGYGYASCKLYGEWALVMRPHTVASQTLRPNCI